MGYIALLDNNKEWGFSIDFIEDFFNENYSNYQVAKINSKVRPYSYEWKIKKPLIEGYLHKDGDSIHIDGEFNDCFTFIIKLRKKIPEKQPLLFFDSSYNYNAQVTQNTTVDDLKKIFI